MGHWIRRHVQTFGGMVHSRVAHKLAVASHIGSQVALSCYGRSMLQRLPNSGSSVVRSDRHGLGLGVQAPCQRPANGTAAPRPICKVAVKDAQSTSSAAAPTEQPTKLRNTFDVLSDDLQYLQQHTGVDLSTSFSSVKEAHDQVGICSSPAEDVMQLI